jgi:hypothetical protein
MLLCSMVIFDKHCLLVSQAELGLNGVFTIASDSCIVQNLLSLKCIYIFHFSNIHAGIFIKMLKSGSLTIFGSKRASLRIIEGVLCPTS